MEPSERKKARIRFKQINHIVDELFRHLSPTVAALLVVAWRDADVFGRWSMSKKQLGEVLGMSERNVSTALQRLIKIGAVRVLKKESGRRPPIYKLTFKIDCLGVKDSSSLSSTHNHIEG